MDFVPGFLQGTTRVLISYPFDYLKTHLQMNKCSLKTFVSTHSLQSMYRGVALPLATVPIDRALQYRIFEYCNSKMNPFGSGIVCGAISSLINLPFSAISNNYILAEKETSMRKYIQTLYRANNSAFFLNGCKPELMRSLVSTTIYLGVYGNMRNKFGNSKSQCVINSVTAGITLWTVAYPLDTLKVEQQTNKNLSMFTIVRQRTLNYGFLNLWRGISAVYARTLPSSTLGMLVYESSKKYIENLK